MTKAVTEYVNFNPKLHKEFPIARQCKVYSKNKIVNVFLDTNIPVESINDSFGFDSSGKFYYVEYGQWHNMVTGKYKPLEEFFDLDEFELNDYEFVCFVVKVYLKGEYRTCYHETNGNKLIISFIPHKMVDFDEKTAEIIYKV